MATIQVRDIPDETYESLRRQAAESGRSLQQYMREHLIDMVEERERKAAAIARMEDLLRAHGGAGATPDEIVDLLHADRR